MNEVNINTSQIFLRGKNITNSNIYLYRGHIIPLMATAGNRTQEFTISPFLTPEQVSILIGAHVKTVRRWLNRSDGPIQGRKIGGRWKIPAAEINRILPGGNQNEGVNYGVS